jgi:hypothetical protein
MATRCFHLPRIKIVGVRPYPCAKCQSEAYQPQPACKATTSSTMASITKFGGSRLLYPTNSRAHRNSRVKTFTYLQHPIFPS